jgi:Uma2 family endonuclease
LIGQLAEEHSMTALQKPLPPLETLADLLERLGDIPLNRIRLRPAPGAATEADVIALENQENRLCELVEGVLVEKVMGFQEACLAGVLLAVLRDFVVPRNLGLVSGADGMMRLLPGLIRIPDVAFVSWDRLPGRRMPTDAVPGIAPDLAVEVLSPGNTDAEMARKRHDYFAAGVRLVWQVDHRDRSVTVYSTENSKRHVGGNESLDGGDVLPGFSVTLHSLFAELDRQGNR